MNLKEAKILFNTDKDAYGKPKAIINKLKQVFQSFEISEYDTTLSLIMMVEAFENRENLTQQEGIAIQNAKRIIDNYKIKNPNIKI